MFIVTDEILDADDVAKMLKLNAQTVKRLANRGELPGFKIGGRWRFERTDIEAHIKALKEKQQHQKD